jgi:hypothetical protein
MLLGLLVAMVVVVVVVVMMMMLSWSGGVPAWQTPTEPKQSQSKRRLML